MAGSLSWSAGTNRITFSKRITVTGNANTIQKLAQNARYRKFDLKTIEGNAAKQATKTAQRVYTSKLLRSSNPPERKGRVTTMGGLDSAIHYWVKAPGLIVLDTVALDEATANEYSGGTAFYWRVQEIGTASSANVFIHKAAPTPQFPGNRVSTVFDSWNFSSQIGRGISRKLAWSKDGAKAVPPGGRDPGQNLFFVTDRVAYQAAAKDRSDRVKERTEAGLVIGREIKGKHFVRSGTVAGFTSLKGRTIAEVRKLGILNG